MVDLIIRSPSWIVNVTLKAINRKLPGSSKNCESISGGVIGKTFDYKSVVKK